MIYSFIIISSIDNNNNNNSFKLEGKRNYTEIKTTTTTRIEI